MCYDFYMSKGGKASKSGSATRPEQLRLFKEPVKRGGFRRGAGRPAKGPRSSERHETRERFSARHPVHVNIRVERDVGQLRRRRAHQAIRRALETTLGKSDFRVVHISLQREHIHLVVEATDAMSLAKGMQGFQISAARRLNAAISREREVERRGQVFADRYHSRTLKTPTEVRNALAYVLNNWRHHGEDGGIWSMFWQVDPFSTGSTFRGWKNLTSIETPFDDLDEPSGARYPLRTATAQTWLLSVGWMKLGLLRVDQVPGAPSRPTNR